MRKSVVLGACLVAGITLLSACSDSQQLKLSSIKHDTVYLGADGAIELADVEKFDKSYYSQSELRTFIKDTISEYEETADAGEVKMEDFSVKNNVAKVLLTFDSPETYQAFQGDEFQLMDTANLEENIVLPDRFVSAADGKSVSKDEVLGEKDMKILIVNDALEIQVEGTILYYSEGNLIGDNSIQTTEEKAAVILYR